MTTLIAFTPNATRLFQAQITLDGQPYTVIVTWASWGQRWYFNLLAASGVLVVSEGLIGSADAAMFALTTVTGSYLASVSPAPTLNGVLLRGQAVNSTNVPPATTLSVVAGANLRLSNPATVTGTDSAASFGYNVNLVAGYGFTSTVVFRESAQQFEITP